MGGAVACRRGRQLATAALVWVGLSRLARPSFSSGRSLGTALEAGECPEPAARRRRRSGAGSGEAGASELKMGPRRPARAAGKERRRGHSPWARCGTAAGERGGAFRLPQLKFLLCARPGRGPCWRPWAYSADGETEAHFGTLDALIPESSPSIPRPPDDSVSIFTCKNCGPETGIMTGRGRGVGKDISEHRQCTWSLLFL